MAGHGRTASCRPPDADLLATCDRAARFPAGRARIARSRSASQRPLPSPSQSSGSRRSPRASTVVVAALAQPLRAGRVLRRRARPSVLDAAVPRPGAVHRCADRRLRHSARYRGATRRCSGRDQVATRSRSASASASALMAVSGWLIFRIVREHTAWRPGGMARRRAVLALLEIHRFHGGFPRAFVHPVVLLTVLLAIRRRRPAGRRGSRPPAALVLSARRAARGRGPQRLGGCWCAGRGSTGARAAFARAGAGLGSSRRSAGGGGSPHVTAARREVPRVRPAGRCTSSRRRRWSNCGRTGAGSTSARPGASLALAAVLLPCARADCGLLRGEVLALPVGALARAGPWRRPCCSSSTCRIDSRIRWSRSSRSWSGSRCADVERPRGGRGPVRAVAMLAAPARICAFAVLQCSRWRRSRPPRPLAAMALIGAVALALAAAAVPLALRSAGRPERR